MNIRVDFLGVVKNVAQPMKYDGTELGNINLPKFFQARKGSDDSHSSKDSHLLNTRKVFKEECYNTDDDNAEVKNEER